MDTKTKLKEYFANFYKENIKDDDNLFLLGAIDSMGIVGLIQYLEESLGVSVEPDEISAENFESLNSIADLVQTKTN